MFPIACGDDSKPATDTSSQVETTPDAVSETSPETTPDVIEETTPDAIEETKPDIFEEVTPDIIEETTTPPAKVNEDCSEAGYTACFINADCETSERCENMSANEVEIPCCATGARGTKVTGEPCESENECDTSLCISRNDGPRLCSMPCDGSEGACPAAANECVFGFCVPPNQ